MAETDQQRLDRLLKHAGWDADDARQQPADSHTRAYLEGRVVGLLTAAYFLDALDQSTAEGLAQGLLKRPLTVADMFQDETEGDETGS